MGSLKQIQQRGSGGMPCVVPETKPCLPVFLVIVAGWHQQPLNGLASVLLSLGAANVKYFQLLPFRLGSVEHAVQHPAIVFGTGVAGALLPGPLK